MYDTLVGRDGRVGTFSPGVSEIDLSNANYKNVMLLLITSL